MRIAAALLVLFGVMQTAMAQSTIKPGGVLVFGGAGRAGAEIVKVLAARGEPVSVFVRPTTDRKRLAGLDVNYVEGDALKPADVAAAFAAARPRVAINAMYPGGRGATGFWDVTQKAITATAKAQGGVTVVFLSSVGVGDSAAAYSPEALERGRATLAERYAAEEDLKASGLTYLIVRTGIVAPENIPPTGQATLTEDRRVLAPVTRGDLAALIADCLARSACLNRTYAAADPTIQLGPPRR